MMMNVKFSVKEKQGMVACKKLESKDLVIGDSSGDLLHLTQTLLNKN